MQLFSIKRHIGWRHRQRVGHDNLDGADHIPQQWRSTFFAKEPQLAIRREWNHVGVWFVLFRQTKTVASSFLCSAVPGDRRNDDRMWNRKSLCRSWNQYSGCNRNLRFRSFRHHTNSHSFHHHPVSWMERMIFCLREAAGSRTFKLSPTPKTRSGGAKLPHRFRFHQSPNEL